MANASNRRKAKFKKWVSRAVISLLGLVGVVCLRPYADFANI